MKIAKNEGDLIFPAETITPEQMAKLIRYGSGIVCLCITDEQCKQLDLPPMVEHNNSVNKTAFTVTIEAAEGVSTGVSAQDRVTTIKAAIADHANRQIFTVQDMFSPLPCRRRGCFGTSWSY